MEQSVDVAALLFRFAACRRLEAAELLFFFFCATSDSDADDEVSEELSSRSKANMPAVFARERAAEP